MIFVAQYRLNAFSAVSKNRVIDERIWDDLRQRVLRDAMMKMEDNGVFMVEIRKTVEPWDGMSYPP